MTIKKDLIDSIAHYLAYAEWSTSENMKNAQHVLDNANIEQLWSMYKIVNRKEIFSVLPCNPADHVAISYAGCYCGIEIDGYVHS